MSVEQHVRHDRDSVVDAALRILDEWGLPELTMRRLAAALDVQPSALYHHFANKQKLLAAVADRIQDAARPAPSPTTGWYEATLAEAVNVRDALLTYRDGAEVVLSTRALGLGADSAHARLTGALCRGHDPETADLVATALLHLILGDASLAQQRLQADSLGVVSPDAADASDPGLVFRLGVELLLSGLELAEQTARRPAE
ncbi:MAG TPA: TetR family transcriptional regulator [Protaetiibacter sp.]|nr:TetR family transcriptional regulator [Protaetiibacter sp.]